MDRHVVLNKLESLRRCIVRIEEKRAASLADLEADLDLQDILALNLTRAVQVCVDIAAHITADLEVPPPATMGETFEALRDAGVLSATLATRMRGAVGFRNVAVHAYQAIEWAVVFAISQNHLEDFRAFASSVVHHLDKSEATS